MGQSNPVQVPLEVDNLLTDPSTDDDSAGNVPYRELIGGSLMYLAVFTRPDISLAVSVLSQFNDCFKEKQWKAAKKVLRYLAGTLNFCLHYSPSVEGIRGYVDADWAGFKMDRRSYSGFVFVLNGRAISWESRKQRSVAASSCESEYIALSEATKELIYLRAFMTELGMQNLPKNILFNDNRGTELLANNPVSHNRSKHINLSYHFVREKLKNGVFVVKHMAGKDMPADMLTKALPKDKLLRCINALGITRLSD